MIIHCVIRGFPSILESPGIFLSKLRVLKVLENGWSLKVPEFEFLNLGIF